MLLWFLRIKFAYDITPVGLLKNLKLDTTVIFSTLKFSDGFKVDYELFKWIFLDVWTYVVGTDSVRLNFRLMTDFLWISTLIEKFEYVEESWGLWQEFVQFLRQFFSCLPQAFDEFLPQIWIKLGTSRKKHIFSHIKHTFSDLPQVFI